MAKLTIRIATRNSPLALCQAEHVRNVLLHHWPKLEIILVPMTTSGDKFLLSKGIGKGLFVKELEEALLDDRADIAVHSMKDVPSTFPPGLGLLAIGKRHDPSDAFISHQYASLAMLPRGATVGTSSLRRQAQLLAYRPDLEIKPIRGNIQTRLERLKKDPLDALILATAGLERMNYHSMIQEKISVDRMLPACGQGALGIEGILENTAILPYLKPFHDEQTAHCVTTERKVNALLGGNCHTPIALYCQWVNHETLHMQAKVMSANGEVTLYAENQGPSEQSEHLARTCANDLLEQGARTLLESI